MEIKQQAGRNARVMWPLTAYSVPFSSKIRDPAFCVVVLPRVETPSPLVYPNDVTNTHMSLAIRKAPYN